ncbi:hypothetical protein ACFU93_29285 [Streptomyces sp. NPDC057611]|uniref:hypothetical protein n=1 Tax=Streptomyces sp. NPDC057611 TaxID=3346182 RepID=UPI0036783EB8
MGYGLLEIPSNLALRRFSATMLRSPATPWAFEVGLLAEDKSMHPGICGPIYDQMDLVNDKAFGFRAIVPRTST